MTMVMPQADHGRHAGQRDAGRLVLGRADLHEIPQRGHRQRQVGVVGQQALAAARTLGSDGPVVRGGDAEHVLRGDLRRGLADGLQAGQLALEVEAGELLRLVERQRLVGVDRQQPGQLVGADLLGHDQRGDLFLQIDRQAEVEQAEQQHRVFRLPVGRPVAGLGQVHRQALAVAEHVGVDAARVDLEEAFQPRRGAGIELLGAALEVHRAHEPVHLQHAGAGHFRQAPFGQQAHADHLAEAVAGMHVAQGEQRIVEGARLDQRHAEGVATDRGAFRQALDAFHAARRRHAVGIATVEQGLAAGEAGQRGGKGQAGQRAHGEIPWQAIGRGVAAARDGPIAADRP
jgi:hypothetical protein